MLLQARQTPEENKYERPPLPPKTRTRTRIPIGSSPLACEPRLVTQSIFLHQQNRPRNYFDSALLFCMVDHFDKLVIAAQ